jgi:hypothetical protein
MKRISLTLSAFISFILSVQSQELELPGKGEITLKEVSVDTVYYVPIKILKRPRVSNMVINFTDANKQTETASKGKDYDYVENDLDARTITSTSPEYFSIGVIVKSRKIKRDKITFQLTLSYKINNQDRFETLKVNIDPFIPLVDKKELPDTSKWSLRIVTGSNFDFFDAPTFKNFAGNISIRTPDLIQIKNKDNPKRIISLGLETGFFNYRYFEADSSRGRIYTDKYLLDAAVTKIATDTTKYVRDIYALNNKISYNTVGAYLNPIISLPTDSKWIDLYISLHIEMLWRTEVQEFNKVSLRKDTMIVTKVDVSQGIVLQSFPGLRPLYDKKSFNDTYIGLGLPFKVNIKKLFELYIAPTIGIAMFEMTNIRTETRNAITYRSFEVNKVSKMFLLTKVQLTTYVTPIDIALGGEFRQIAGQKTFYALYLGAALSLDKFIKK